MHTFLSILAATAALAAVPATAATPIRLGNGAQIVRMKYADLQQPAGRASLLAGLQDAAERACDGVHPARSARACEAEVVARAEREAIPQVGRAIRLARVEQEGTALASR